MFAVLGEAVLPCLGQAAAGAGRSEVRCWSAGCASGEEVYTLKMVWRHNRDRIPGSVRLSITATDSDPHMLERARRGIYERGSLRELPEDWLDRYLAPADGSYGVPDDLRSAIEFHEQDIRIEQPPGPFDLILCRHLVFTYFDEDLQRRLLPRMVDLLTPDGALVTGKQERLPTGAGDALVEWAPHTGVYRKKA